MVLVCRISVSCRVMKWETSILTTDGGAQVQAVEPVIVSASRAMDIPAFWADWFFGRLRAGYSVWVNPFDRKRSYVSYARTRLIVFWSKNPAPLLAHLSELEQRGIHCYVQFTLNDYEREGLEPGVPPLTQRIDTFRRLVDRLGFGRVIWRFDPLVLTRRTGVAELLERAAAIGDQLKGYTERMVFSFVDLAAYRGAALRMARTGLGCREFTPEEMTLWAEGLSALNGRWNFELATCAEEVDLGRFGIEHNRCVDDRLMIRYFSEDRELMRFLGWPERYRTDTFLPLATNPNRDRGQRRACGCVWSKDIGAYGTCPHGCLYCYAARRTGMGSGAGRAGTSWPESLQELAGGFTGVVPENR